MTRHLIMKYEYTGYDCISYLQAAVENSTEIASHCDPKPQLFQAVYYCAANKNSCFHRDQSTMLTFLYSRRSILFGMWIYYVYLNLAIALIKSSISL